MFCFSFSPDVRLQLLDMDLAVIISLVLDHNVTSVYEAQSP